MFLFGCLLAFAIAFAPRVMLILAWIFSERWDRVWDTWLWPVLGIVFAPYTTIMYMLVYTPNGIEGWDWMWIIMGVILDVMKWGQVAANRNRIPGYPGEAPSTTPAV